MVFDLSLEVSKTHGQIDFLRAPNLSLCFSKTLSMPVWFMNAKGHS